MKEHCPHIDICNGCFYGKLDYQEQLLRKKQTLIDHLSDVSLHIPEIKLSTMGSHFLRQRFDFTIFDNKMGLFDKNKNLVDLDTCFQLSPELLKAFKDFKTVAFPIKKGSVRLRVSPSGERGAWLDFANLDIKNLLAEKKSLDQLLQLNFIVEIGQKGKLLQKIDETYKLSDPAAHFWFKTKNYGLKSLISSFTQPSWISADLLTESILQWLPDSALKLVEFGSGIGQFTLPLLAAGFSVDVFESDLQASQLLYLNAKSHKLEKKLIINQGDYQHKNLPKKNISYDVVLVNPPRSGLKNFTDEITALNLKNIIYVSCFPESLSIDLKKLSLAGFKLKEITLVDQFPQTKHFETCVLLQRIDF